MTATLSKAFRTALLNNTALGITAVAPDRARVAFDKIVFATDARGHATATFWYQGQETSSVGPLPFRPGDELTITGIEGHQDITVT